VIAVLLLLSALLATDFLLIPFLVGVFKNLKSASSGYRERFTGKENGAVLQTKPQSSRPLIKVSEPSRPANVMDKIKAIKFSDTNKGASSAPAEVPRPARVNVDAGAENDKSAVKAKGASWIHLLRWHPER
jgi:hypothetical protein